MGFPGGWDGKESACNVGDLGLIPGLERSPGGGHGNPLQYPCLENPHGQRSLVGYRPWGHKELDTTERLSTVHNTSTPISWIPAIFPINCPLFRADIIFHCFCFTFYLLLHLTIPQLYHTFSLIISFSVPLHSQRVVYSLLPSLLYFATFLNLL